MSLLILDFILNHWAALFAFIVGLGVAGYAVKKLDDDERPS